MRRLDYKEQLIDYFKKNISKGYTSDALKFSLVKQGYSRVIVDQAFEQANKELAEKAPTLKEKPVIKYSIYDEKNNPIHLQPLSFWEKIRGLFRK
jgi:SOS response regulatory protein OraA/RecX